MFFPFLTQPHACHLCFRGGCDTTPAREGHQQSWERFQGWVMVSLSDSCEELLAEVSRYL